MFKLFKLSNKKTKVLAIVALIFVALQGVFEGLQTMMLAQIVNVLGDGTQTVDVPLFWTRVALLMINAIFSLVCGIFGSWFGVKSSLLLAETIRHNMFYKATTLSFGDIDRISTSSILTRITNDVQKYQMAMQLALALFIRAPIMFFYGIVASFVRNWVFGVLFTGVMLLIILGFVFSARKIVPAFEQVQIEIDNANVVVRENVLGMKVIKSFCLEEQQAERFAVSNETLRKQNTKAWVGFGLIFPALNAIVNLTMGAIFLIAGKMFIDGTLTPAGKDMATAAAIYEVVNLLMVTLASVIISCMVVINCVRAMPSARRINEFLSSEPSIKNCEHPLELRNNYAHSYDLNNKQFIYPNGDANLDIEFKNLNFKYFEDAEKPVLKNINLKIKQGEMLGIVGPTGSGKTSLINLISRLYDFKEDGKSRLTIGGIPVKQIDLNSLQKHIGVVIQERILFSGTIRENLKYGDQTASDDQLMKYAAIACADKVITEKEGGLSAVVEQRGRNFSGGQQQRLSITRTLVKQPNILILDDSTSALDMLTEAKLQSNIRKQMKGMTTIIVAQRISSVKDCDHIVVMEKGEIVGYGNHDSLRKNNELYRSIVLSQMGEEGLN